MPIQLPFYDDFTNIDPLVWTKVNQSGEVFDSNGSYLVANSSSSSFNYMTTNNLLSGDFDAVMEFETFTFQGSDSNIELILDDPDIALATLAIVRATTSEGSLFSTYYNGSFDSTNIKARNRISKSKIKLNRKGDLLSMYVADSFSSEFQLLVEVSNFITTDVRLRIRVRGNGAINANIYNLSIKPISNNLIQYNGQDILDVKYSDQNSVLQDVEMRLGSTVVWGGVETLYGLDFSKSSAQDRGVVIYSDTGNTKLTFRNDFKVIGRASFKADTMLISSNLRNDQYIFLRPEGVVECVANFPTNNRVRTTTTLVEGEFFDIIVERTGSTVTLKVNNEEVSFNYNAPVSYGLFGNDLTFPDYPYTGILSGTWEFYDEDVLIRLFDISESGNAKTGSGQPVLIDTISGENAVGVNMNTDDSNWIDLN